METTLPSAGAADGNLSGTCLPESFFRYMLTTNPFVLNRATADGAERPDAGQIHSPIFGRLIELACESVRLQRGLGVLLSGEAGSGKTHILGRLARWSAVGSRACFVVVRGLQTDPELLPAAVLRSAGMALAGKSGAPPVRTPLYRLAHNAARVAVVDNQDTYAWERVGRAFAKLADRLAPAARRVPEGRAAFDLLFRFFRSAARAAAGKEDGATAVLTLRWLSGGMLDAAEARHLHLPPARHRDDPVMLTDPEWARQGLTALAVLATAVGKPLILAFDQAEELDAGRFAGLARFLHGLLDHAPGILAITAADSAAVQRWRDRGEVAASAWDRLGQFTLEPGRLSPIEGGALVRRRLDDALSAFKHVEFLYRLRADAPLFPVHLALNSCGSWAREVVEAARRAWIVEQEVLRREGSAAWLAGWAERMAPNAGETFSRPADVESSLTHEQMQAAIALRALPGSEVSALADVIAREPAADSDEPVAPSTRQTSKLDFLRNDGTPAPQAVVDDARDTRPPPVSSQADDEETVVETLRCQRPVTMSAAEFFPPEADDVLVCGADDAQASAIEAKIEPSTESDVTVVTSESAADQAPPRIDRPSSLASLPEMALDEVPETLAPSQLEAQRAEVPNPPASPDKETPAARPPMRGTLPFAPSGRRTVLTPKAWPPFAAAADARGEAIDQVVAAALTDYVTSRAHPRELPADAEQVGELILNLLQQCHAADAGYGVLQAERVPTWKAAPAACDLVVRQQAEGDAILRTGILVLMANRATAVAGYLRRLVAENQPFDRLFLITEERVGLPLGPRGLEYLHELQQRSAVQLHTLELTADEYAELCAMRAVVRQARGGSMAVDGERITEPEAIASHHRRQRYLASRFLSAILFDAMPTELLRQIPPPK
jgi:hypothetical protein